MKIEKLSKGRSKKIILSLLIITLLIGVIYITTSKAKYQVTQSVQIVNGKVNYSVSDLNIIALSIQDEDDEEVYNSTNKIPEGNYLINTEKSYCTIPGDTTQYKDIPLEYKDSRVYIGINQKGTKCYIYLDKLILASDQIIANSEVKEELPKSFGVTACDLGTNYASNCGNTDKGLYKTLDDDGETYYFRGSVNNNWVKFAGFYWRIIRINGDKTIRLIYAGKEGDETSLTFTNNNRTNPITVTGAGTQINNTGKTVKTYPFNSIYNDNKYVGLMYGGEKNKGSSTSYDNAHTNTNNSEILDTLSDWYTANLKNINIGFKKASDFIDENAGFCGDRTPYNGYGYGTSQTNYGAYHRLVALSETNKKPTFSCKRADGTGKTSLPIDNDLYTINTSNKGNKSLANPVGLISADEMVFAGSSFGISNSGYYLYSGQDYWIMTPYGYSDSKVFFINSNGALTAAVVNSLYGVRPVINLKANTMFKIANNNNKGTFANPYVVQ